MKLYLTSWLSRCWCVSKCREPPLAQLRDYRIRRVAVLVYGFLWSDFWNQIKEFLMVNDLGTQGGCDLLRQLQTLEMHSVWLVSSLFGFLSVCPVILKSVLGVLAFFLEQAVKEHVLARWWCHYILNHSVITYRSTDHWEYMVNALVSLSLLKVHATEISFDLITPNSIWKEKPHKLLFHSVIVPKAVNSCLIPTQWSQINTQIFLLSWMN